MNPPDPTRRRVLVAGGALLLGACQATPERLASVDRDALWKRRDQRLAALVDWTALGRVALRAGDEAWSASLRWRQDEAESAVQLAGPLGQGAVRIAANPDRVVLRTADGETRTAPSAGDLLEASLGWRIPVAGLRHWILGRPDPLAPLDALELDEAGRAVRVEQAGWVIDYGSYLDIGGLDLPARMSLTHPRLTMRVALSRWDL